MASILSIVPHSLFPPMGGGAQRIFYLLRELARAHDVHVIFPQPESTLSEIRSSYQVPAGITAYGLESFKLQASLFDLLPRRVGSALYYRWKTGNVRASANSFLLNIIPLVEDLVIRKKFDFVIMEHLETVALSPILRRLTPESILAMDAHNVDSELGNSLAQAENDFSKRKNLAKVARSTRKTEENLSKMVDLYFACSEIDCLKLNAMNRDRLPGYCIPNGMATDVLPFDCNPMKRTSSAILFCGSLNTSANRNGLEWFYEHVWPSTLRSRPDLKLKVVGHGASPSDFHKLRRDPSVDFIGDVPSVIGAYHSTALSVVPLRQGSGTRLKVLEAFSLGSPVVSTSIGAEGIHCQDGVNIVLRDEPKEFARAIVALLDDQALFRKLQGEGRRLVENLYDWKVIGKNLNALIAKLVESRRKFISK